MRRILIGAFSIILLLAVLLISYYRAGVVSKDSIGKQIRQSAVSPKKTPQKPIVVSDEVYQKYELIKEIPVLMYHEVGKPRGRWPQLYVDPVVLAEQLDWLNNNGYSTISLEDMYEHWKNKKILPAKPVVLTFDDGYRSAYSIVFPLLRDRNMTATFFPFPTMFNKPDGLTPVMIREMAGKGMEIGGHGYTHADLDKIPETEFARELGESKALIEKITRRPVRFLCYPTGRYNKTVMEAVRKYGYLAAVTMHSGRAAVDQDLYELRRIGIYNRDNLKLFAEKLKQ